MIPLNSGPLNVAIPHSRLLSGVRAISYATITAVIADAVDCYISDDRSIDICVMYNYCIDAGYSCVIAEMSTIPFAAIISASAVAAAIVDAAIISNMRSPVADMPMV